MKRAKRIVDNITLALLRQEAIAAYNARRNKSRRVMAEFRALMAPGGLEALLGELQACTWRPAKPYALTIHEQGRKERHLEIPAFRDIVAQRALAAAGLERVLLRHTHARSYSSIKGRGPLKCAKHLRRLLARGRSARWCLYFDVRKYYEHIDKGVLFADLQRVIKDRRALAILRQVLTIGARGLPIGNTLSHLFANFYLTPILRAIERLPGVSGLACYMDNVHIISASKRKLHRARLAIVKMLAARGLEMKGDWQVFRTAIRPISACGFSIAQGRPMRVSKSIARHIKRALRSFWRTHSPHAARSALSLYGWPLNAGARNLLSKFYHPAALRALKAAA